MNYQVERGIAQYFRRLQTPALVQDATRVHEMVIAENAPTCRAVLNARRYLEALQQDTPGLLQAHATVQDRRAARGVVDAARAALEERRGRVIANATDSKFFLIFRRLEFTHGGAGTPNPNPQN